MRILLDECIDWRLKFEFKGFELKTVKEMGWSGKVNGELLRSLLESGFDVLITVDKNLRFQQNIKNLKLSVIVLDVERNTLRNLKPLIPNLIKFIPDIKVGEVYVVK